MATTLTLYSSAFTASKFSTGISAGCAQTGNNFLPQNTFTAECWASTTNPAAIKVCLAQANAFWMGCDASGNAIAKYGASTKEVTLSTTVSVVDNIAHHFELDLTASGAYFFVDGVLAASSATTPTAAGVNLSAGKPFEVRSLRGSGVSYFDWTGIVDEAAVWTTTRHTSGFTVPSSPYAGNETGLYGLWHLDGDGVDSATGGSAATAVTMTGPTSGTVGSASSNFTVGADGTITGTVVVTPSDGGAGGAFTPTTVSISSGSTTGTFAYTAASAGAKTISVTNNGGLSNPSSITYTASAAAATAVTMTGPTTGTVGSASSNFTVGANGVITGTVIVTPSDGGAGGTFTPTTVSISSGSPTGTFTYTAASTGAKTVSVTNNGGLSNPSSITFTASSGAVSPKLPNDVGIVYSPYNWLTNSSAAKSINPGAYFKTIFSGSSCTLNFDVSNLSAPYPRLLICVDKRTWQMAAVAATVSVTMPTGEDSNKHLLEVIYDAATETVNRWNSPQNTAVVLTGITLASGSDTLAAPTKRPINILCYGDSITEGVRTLALTGASYDLDRNSASICWPLALGECLGAEVGVVGFGLTGINTAGSGNVPALGSSYAYLWASQARNFTPAPKYCVWLEGTNDGSSSTVTNGIAALNGMLSAMAGTKFALVRPLNGTSQETYLQSIASGCSDPSRVAYISSSGFWSSSDSSDSLHPYGYADIASVAPAMASAIRSAFPEASSTWDTVIDGTYTAKSLLRLMSSALLGKVSGAGSNAPVFRDLSDTKNRISATTDSSGNRTAVTLDGS